jgi:hypothetical protein
MRCHPNRTDPADPQISRHERAHKVAQASACETHTPPNRTATVREGTFTPADPRRACDTIDLKWTLSLDAPY